MKYSILMPYFDRLIQLRITLASFIHFYGDRDDYEVIIIEDPKNRDNAQAAVRSFADRVIIRWLEADYKDDCYTPSPFYNQAASEARGEYLVITNPECLHYTDVLGGLDIIFEMMPDIYAVCACQNVLKVTMNGDGFERLSFVREKWFQHSKHANKLLNFCTALSKENYERIGGFDERYAAGFAFADDDFRDRVTDAGIKIVPRDGLVVLHQRHKRFREYVSQAEYRDRHNRNQRLYKQRLLS